MNLDAATSMWAGEDEVPLLAPRATGEPLLVLEGVRADLDDEEDRCGQLFELLGDVGLEDAALGLIFDIRDAAQDAVARRVRQLLGTIFDGNFGFSGCRLEGLAIKAHECGFGRTNDITHHHFPYVERCPEGYRLRP